MVLIKKIIGWAFKLFMWETIVGWVLELAVRMIKIWIAKKRFSKKAKYFIMGIWVMADGFGDELVEDTTTTIDNKTLSILKTLCRDVAAEQNFTLPLVQEL